MTRPKKPKIIWQVSEFGDPVHRCRYFSTLSKAVDYVFKVFPDGRCYSNLDAYDDPCLRAWEIDAERQYLMFVTNGGLVSYDGYPRKPCKKATIARIQSTLDAIIATR
jgi:hypothetical protein